MSDSTVAKPNFIERIGQNLDILFALGIVGIILVLLLPVPTLILDLLLSLSITSAVLILMTTLFIHKPLDLSSFPTILLITAVMRLSLNIASTRLILSEGHQGTHAAGRVIQAFGGFVMQGSVVIGIIIFAILTIINFVVITKGSGRIAEVAARFSLDAMPGKQMAIDADLAAGLITENDAKTRRKELEQESTFYGAMDGANKFVRGDAVAGLLITFINFIGGMIIGIVQRGLSFIEALETYTVLTIGDGLVSQIPALIISLGAGVIVSKSGVSGSAEKAVFDQLGRYPQPLAIAGGVMVAMSMLPGLPTIPFVMLGSGIASLALMARRNAKKVEEEEKEGDSSKEVALTGVDAPLTEALKIETIRLELGYGILPLLNQENGNRLTEQIKSLRQQLAKELGFILPSVRIQDNVALSNHGYRILIKEIECGNGEVKPGKLMIMNPSGNKIDMQGEPTTEPAFGLPAMWVDESMREAAMVKNYTVVDPSTVITTHLTEISKDNIGELLNYSEVQKLLTEIDQDYSKLVSDLIPNQLSVSVLQKIMQNLLEEGVSIRDLPTILASIAEAIPGIKTAARLTEYVRSKLARQISYNHIDKEGFIPVLMVSPGWEQSFNETLVSQGEEQILTMSPSRIQEFLDKARQEFDRVATQGVVPVVLCSPPLRPHLYRLLRRQRQLLTVLSQAEIYPKIKVKTLGQI